MDDMKIKVFIFVKIHFSYKASIAYYPQGGNLHLGCGFLLLKHLDASATLSTMMKWSGLTSEFFGWLQPANAIQILSLYND